MRMIRRIGFIFAVALVASGLALAAEPMLLKFHQKEGDKAVYSATATAKAKMALAGKATAKAKVKAQAATESVRMKCSLDFAKAIGMGRMQIVGRILDGTATVNSGGKSESRPLGGLEVRYVVTALGDIKSDEVTAGELVMLPFSYITFTPEEAFPPGLLPDHAVKVGDTWSSEEEPRLAEGATGRLRYTSAVVGETAFAGRNCLRIRTEARGSAQGDVPISGLANRVPLKANVTATEVWLFDPAEGVVLKSDAKDTMTATATVEGVAAGLTLTAVVEQHVKLIEWNGQPVEAK